MYIQPGLSSWTFDIPIFVLARTNNLFGSSLHIDVFEFVSRVLFNTVKITTYYTRALNINKIRKKKKLMKKITNNY